MKTVCQILKNFTIPNLRTIEISVGLKAMFHQTITQKWNGESFLNFAKLYIPLIIVNNLHYHLFHLVT